MSYTLDIIKQSVSRFARASFDPVFRQRIRERERLASLPRYQATTTSLLGTPLQIVDAHSFLQMYEEIFEREAYKFISKHEVPYIIDGGANIGLSVLYFKRLYPNSEVVAFEPDRAIFSVLEANVGNVETVTLVRRALWSSETTLNFSPEGAWSGRIAQPGDQTKYTVETARLARYLTRPVDFLKLDIEGAETEVLQDCSELLGNVEHIFVEYHSFVNQPQVLDQLLHALAKSGFRVDIHPCGFSLTPFVSQRNSSGMDLQLNLFGYRT